MNRISGPLCLLTLFVLFVFKAGAVEPSGVRWPEWRGAKGQGVSNATNVPAVWSETKNVVWRTPVGGRGWSTPVVEQNRVWVTTARDVTASPQDAERRRKTSTNSQPLRISASVSLRVAGIDLATGKVVV